jgi:hypothetical protein
VVARRAWIRAGYVLAVLAITPLLVWNGFAQQLSAQ